MLVLQAFGLPDAPAGEEQHEEPPQVSPEAPGKEVLPAAKQANPLPPAHRHAMHVLTAHA